MRFRLFGVTFLALMVFLLIYWPTYQAWAGHRIEFNGVSMISDRIKRPSPPAPLPYPREGPGVRAGVVGALNITEVKLLASDRSREHYFGASVSISGELALVGTPKDGDNGIDSGAAYIYRWNGSSWQEEAKLTPTDGVERDLFGNAVSLSGEVALIGSSPNDDSRAGAAYIFRFDGSTWQEEAKLTASDGEIGDAFGQSVSVSGSVALVAAPLDRNGSSSGSVYIFRKSSDGKSWQEERKLTFEDEAGLDSFGESVSIDRDVALIGVSRSNLVHVYRWNGDQWLLEQKLVANDANTGDYFGRSVSVSGDLALIGVPYDDDLAPNAGSAYVFRFDGESWQQEQKLDDKNQDNFGYSVSISGSMALIGALTQEAAILYRFSDEGWQEEARLQPSDGGGKQFGESVSLDGQMALVGAATAEDAIAGQDVGSAYLYNLSSGNVPDITLFPMSIQEAVNGKNSADPLTIANAGTEALSWAVSDSPSWLTTTPVSGTLAPGQRLSVTINMDATDLALGTYREQLTITSNDPDESSLAVDILLSVMPYQQTIFPAHEPSDHFGHSVSVDGDVAIVGVPSYAYRIPSSTSGMAQIYRFDGRQWELEQLLQASDWVLGDRFGSVVSIHGDVAIVGTRLNSVYLFRWDGNQWQQEQKLDGSNKNVSFGVRVDISENMAFIAAQGAVYVYRFAGSSWQLEQTLSASDENESSFGYSLSASGNYLLVGAPEEDADDEQDESGVAYLFRFDGSSWIEEAKLIASDAAEVYNFGTSVSLSRNKDKALIRARNSAYIWRRHQNGEQWQEEARFAINNVFNFIEFPYHKSVALDGNRAVIHRDDNFLAIFQWDGSRWVEENAPFQIKRVDDEHPKGYFSSTPPLSLSGSRLLVGDAWQSGTDSAYFYDLSVKIPDITMSRSNLSLALVEGTSRSERLTITNNTTETLVLQCRASCLANNWLNVTPISSTLPPMTSQELLIEMDATTLKREDYSHLLTMTSEKADFRPINVPVSLNVIPSERQLSGSKVLADNQFGQAVSIHGDLALVGSTPDSSNSQEPGSAYLYRWNGSNWQQEARLTASDGTAGNGFGRAVALSDSVAVVSAPFREKNGSDLGTVYVYRKNGDTWQESIVTGRGDEFYFGISVSISGDLLLVGTPFANTNNQQSGAVYVFRWNGESWQQESRLFLSNGSRFGYFGSSVSVSGDGNGDGNTALIAASGESQGDSNGLAYIYRWDGSNWQQEQTLQPSAGGYFGGTVSLSGDVALIGHHTGGQQKHGAGYFFRFNGQNWVEEAAFQGEKWHHEFGYSVSVDGNLAIIGARSDDQFNSDSGAASVYRWDGANWQEQYKIGATNGAQFDHFGTSIALSGENALIGAPFNDQHGHNSGSAYLYDLSAASAIWLPIVIK